MGIGTGSAHYVDFSEAGLVGDTFRSAFCECRNRLQRVGMRAPKYEVISSRNKNLGMPMQLCAPPCTYVLWYDYVHILLPILCTYILYYLTVCIVVCVNMC